MPFKEPILGVKTMVTTSSESVEDRLDRISKLAEQGGGASKIEEQHKKGKKTARERLRMLLLIRSHSSQIDKLVVSRSEDHVSGSKYYSEGVVTGDEYGGRADRIRIVMILRFRADLSEKWWERKSTR